MEHSEESRPSTMLSLGIRGKERSVISLHFPVMTFQYHPKMVNVYGGEGGGGEQMRPGMGAKGYNSL